MFGDDETETDRVLAKTSSGGAAVNTGALQGGLPSLAFGGSGNNGMGRQHGIEGFRKFSNPRGIVVRGKQVDHIDAFMLLEARLQRWPTTRFGKGPRLKDR